MMITPRTTCYGLESSPARIRPLLIRPISSAPNKSPDHGSGTTEQTGDEQDPLRAARAGHRRQRDLGPVLRHQHRLDQVPGDAVSGVAAALAGMLYAGRLHSGRFQFGEGDELSVIAAAVLGGTSLFGGAGTVIGSIMGALMIGLINNGLSWRAGFQPAAVARGAIIILAVAIGPEEVKDERADPRQPTFFDAHQRATIEAAMARIIPTDDMPGAREAGTVDFVDRYLSGIGYIYAKPDGSGFETLSGRCAAAWQRRVEHGPGRSTPTASRTRPPRPGVPASDFVGLTPRQQDQILAELERGVEHEAS